MGGRKPLHRVGFRAIRALNKLMDRLNIKLEVRPKAAADRLTSEQSMLYFFFSMIVKQSLIKEYHYTEEEKEHIYKLCS